MHPTTKTVAAVTVAVLLLGCKGEQPASPPAPAARAADVYTLRGEVVRLPAAGAKPAELSIRHEAIPDFKNAAGEVVGMQPMVMPFAVGPTVSLDGIEPGDKIRFRFTMDWPKNALQIESIEELPRDTALDFGHGR
jgi:Cu/Ag efflux protein CusF